LSDTEFARRTVDQRIDLRRGRTALLVVDMLNDFCAPAGAMPLVGADVLYGPIDALARGLRDRGGAVICVADRHEPGDREFAKRTPHCLAGSWGAQIVPELRPEPGDRIVPKRRYSSFFGTDLDLLVRELGVTALVVAGVVTNICVRSTVHDAFFLGYDVVVARDAVAATGTREQESSLWDIETHFGVVAYHPDILRMLAGSL
jgi:ureidoacrylate peracid hydrolase